jgi:integrase
MAIDMKEFSEIVETGLKANNKYTRFFYRFKIEGTTKRGLIDYSNKDWDKRTRVSKAKQELLKLKSKQIDTSLNFTENTSLNNLAKIYFENACSQTTWSKELQRVYELYCFDGIGKKKIKDIRKVHIDNLRQTMEIKGHSKQTENGCSPRSIKKVLHQILRPMLEYAVENKVIDDMPTIKVPPQKRTKKKVNDGGIKLATLYKTIFELYHDNGFYRALFLFALYGRRWNEIRTLKWNDINLLNGTYTVQAENNKIGEEQTYDLPEPIRVALSEIKDDNKGLIFKSPTTSKELYPPKKQLSRVRELSGIEELTMHYFRHILVSAMGEMGTATTVLSASLGHTNLNTVNDFYLSANHIKSSKEANLTIETITSQGTS